MKVSHKCRPERPSKRIPTMETSLNCADRLERLLQQDRFKTWGFVIYRCTYQSNSDWEKFITRFLYSVTSFLKYYNGLDLLDSFAPTVFEDRAFDSATTALLRKHFQEWAVIAPQEEQGIEHSCFPNSGRYRFFIMVDQEALESVLSVPEPHYPSTTGFVRLVNGVWKPEELDQDELEERGLSKPSELEEFEPLEGCRLEDVGWMKVSFQDAELPAFLKFCDNLRWLRYYRRPPLIPEWI
ncbi:hypothetical protein ETB97_002420 [Aspergillus alliaceus]|uniref:Muramidase n=1 Tax=Petromyces alliaceus TaxID=209559 RepID=A0A8H6A0U4_PETAA|nr:hypothetical protein ETB97_002420 [Aspergillus burnettii]